MKSKRSGLQAGSGSFLLLLLLFLLSALKFVGIKDTDWTRSCCCGVNEAYLTCGSLSSSNIITLQPRSGQPDQSEVRSGKAGQIEDTEKVKCYHHTGWKIKIISLEKAIRQIFGLSTLTRL